MGYIKIKTVQQLKEMCKDQNLSCFISLAGGTARSSKTISWNSETQLFEILNEIDGTYQIISENELETESNIHETIIKGAFYKY